MNKEKEHKKSDISFNEKTDYFSFLDRHIGSTQSEIDELNKLIDSHKASIERLEAHVSDLQKQLEPTKD